MRIIITGASGKFGRAATHLLADRIPVENLILVSRSPEKLSDWEERGATVRRGDFNDPQSMFEAFAGGTVMLLISSIKVGHRVPQHRNAIEAATAAGVERIVYTSFIGSRDDNTALANRDHYATEQLLFQSDVNWTILRDGLYADAIIDVVGPVALRNGTWISAAGDGMINFVDRDDCVHCAVAVLTEQRHANRIYEINAGRLWSFREVAGLISEAGGRHIEYTVVDNEKLYEHFDDLGIPRRPFEGFEVNGYTSCSDDIVSLEDAMRRGKFATEGSHIAEILGRPPRDLTDIVRDRQEWLRRVANTATDGSR